MPLLEVKHLSRHYGPLKAVDDVSFTVERGAVMGFIGPNGAGKSTTLRILATLDLPTSGEVLLEGDSLVEYPDRARPRLGYMPDRYGTYEDMTVAEFLDFFARAYRLSGAQRKSRVEEVIEFTRLTSLRSRMTRDLSKGMKQRVALGRTLLNDPALLILDEPADGLDPRARIELRELLKILAEQGKAVLISSHILTELSEICDHAVILEQGRLLAQGKVAELMAGGGGGLTAEVTIRLLPSAADAVARTERFLLEQPQVQSVAVHERALRVRLKVPESPPPEWAERSQQELLRALVAAELPVISFERKEADLEDAFMRVTRGKVA